MEWIAQSWAWLDDNKDSLDGLKSLLITLGVAVGAFWGCYLFWIRREYAPYSEFDTDIKFVGRQGDRWLVEVLAIISNRGATRLAMHELGFTLKTMMPKDPVHHDDAHNGQTRIGEGSYSGVPRRGHWLPPEDKVTAKDKKWVRTYVEPRTTVRYSYVADIAASAAFAHVHGKFYYKVGWPIRWRSTFHTSDRLVCVPADEMALSVSARTPGAGSDAADRGMR